MERSVPTGWRYCRDSTGKINRYAIEKGEWTVCRVSGEYELWKGKEQLHVHLPTAAEAIALATDEGA